jgi:hypothetical protein
MKRQDGKTICRTARQQGTGRHGLNESSDESRTDAESTKVAAMATLSLAMLQQRWHCSSQHYYYYGVIAHNAAIAVVLQLTMLLLLWRCSSQHCYCCGAAVATAMAL